MFTAVDFCLTQTPIHFCGEIYYNASLTLSSEQRGILKHGLPWRPQPCHWQQQQQQPHACDIQINTSSRAHTREFTLHELDTPPNTHTHRHTHVVHVHFLECTPAEKHACTAGSMAPSDYVLNNSLSSCSSLKRQKKIKIKKIQPRRLSNAVAQRTNYGTFMLSASARVPHVFLHDKNLISAAIFFVSHVVQMSLRSHSRFVIQRDECELFFNEALEDECGSTVNSAIVQMHIQFDTFFFFL